MEDREIDYYTQLMLIGKFAGDGSLPSLPAVLVPVSTPDVLYGMVAVHPVATCICTLVVACIAKTALAMAVLWRELPSPRILRAQIFMSMES